MSKELWVALAVVAVFILLVVILEARRAVVRRKVRQMPGAEKRKELEEELRPFGYGYDAAQDLFYSLKDAWQRKYGYCRLYDETAPSMSMILDSEPITFDYDGKHWLIEFWKGQYGMITGGEIGIYHTDREEVYIPGTFRGNFYESVPDEDCLYMAFYLKKDGKVICSRKDRHWWLTGFKLALFSEPSELSMDIKLTFPAEEMCGAFVEGMQKAGYEREELIIGPRSVFFCFERPRSQQPAAGTPALARIMQRNNKGYCRWYRLVTRDFPSTVDKLTYLRYYLPNLYATALRMGHRRDLYRDYADIQFYQDGE